MSTRAIGLVLFSAAALFCGFKILHEDGIVGQTKKPLAAPVFLEKGCFCHGDTASVLVRAWIDGPESLAAGTRALYSINVAKDSSIAAGFDVAAFFGELGVYDTAETQLMRVDPNNPVDSLELTHVDPKLAGGRDTVSWFFYYRAPSTVGRVDTIYANGNSVDLSIDPAGDFWCFAPSFLVHVTSSVDVPLATLAQSFRLDQNYPNPFNPSTLIRFETPVAGRAHLDVFDVTGRKVATLVDDFLHTGVHEVRFVAEEASELSSGVYLYQLTVEQSNGEQAQRFTATKKMLLIK